MSWIDRWIARVEGRRTPAWLVYALMFVLVGLVAATPGWLDDSAPPGRFTPLDFLLPFWTVFPLALMHYLDRYAARALHVFRAAMDADDEDLESWRWSLGTMPSAAGRWAGVGGVGFLWVVLLVSPELFRPIQTSDLHFGLGMAQLSLNFALLGSLIYHTIRQLILVNQIYSRVHRIDLFRLSPLYAFSGLTARTGIAWTLALYLSAALFPEFLRSGLAAGFFALEILLVLGTFAWPLVGIHNRLVAEKDRALGEIGQRLTRAMGELQSRTDAMDLTQMDALNKMVTALAAGRDLLLKVPTWPWTPGTPLAVLTTLLLPVGIYLVQRFLEEVVGL